MSESFGKASGKVGPLFGGKAPWIAPASLDQNHPDPDLQVFAQVVMLPRHVVSRANRLGVHVDLEKVEQVMRDYNGVVQERLEAAMRKEAEWVMRMALIPEKPETEMAPTLG